MESSSNTTFDFLPPMPAPYEDFQFTMEYHVPHVDPNDLDPSELAMLRSPPYSGIFADSPFGMAGRSHNHEDAFPRIGFSTPYELGYTTALPKHTPSTAFAALPSPDSPGATPTNDLASPSGPPAPPPPPPFAPPAGNSLFSMDEPNAPHNWGNESSASTSHSQAAPKGSNNALFDSTEKNFLMNFLEGFSDWEFAPKLPDDLPSFSTAALERTKNDPIMARVGVAARSRAQGQGTGHDGHAANAFGMDGWSDGEDGDSTTPTDSTKDGGAGRKRGARTQGMAAAMAPMPATPVAASGKPHSALSRKTSKAVLQRGGAAKGGPAHGAMEVDSAPAGVALGKKFKTEHDPEDASAAATLAGFYPPAAPLPSVTAPPSKSDDVANPSGAEAAGSIDGSTSNAPGGRRELLTDSEKRMNHILSEQRRRNHIREGFMELAELLQAGRGFGARGLGLAAGAGTGVEDEGLDDRSDDEDEGPKPAPSDPAGAKGAAARRKKKRPTTTGGRGKGKGRGRGGSAGGGAGSKSAVLFQAVDLIRWLEERNEQIDEDCAQLESLEGVRPRARPRVTESA